MFHHEQDLTMSLQGIFFKTYKYWSQDGGGIGRGDHFLFYKFIERTTER